MIPSNTYLDSAKQRGQTPGSPSSEIMSIVREIEQQCKCLWKFQEMTKKLLQYYFGSPA
jgi:hypothetical protein